MSGEATGDHSNNHNHKREKDEDGGGVSAANLICDASQQQKKARTEESYLQFRGRKGPRVGTDFQATTLPMPDPSHYIGTPIPQHQQHSTTTSDNDENRVPLENDK